MYSNLRRQKSLIKKLILRRMALFHPPERMFGNIILTAIVIWLLATACAHADKIILKNGNVLVGVITKQGRTSVVLEHSDLGRMEILRSRIESMTIDTPEIEISLKNGDTIEGKLVKEDESTITLEHRDLGRIKIPRERIATSISTAPKVTIGLAGGNSIQGKLIERSDFAIVIEHADLGRLEIPRERIDTLKVETTTKVKEDESTGLFDPTLRKLAAKSSRLKEKGWGASVDLSWDSSSSETEEQTSRYGARIRRKLNDGRMGLDTSYYRKVSDDDLKDNKLTIGMVRDWLKPEKSRWFYFLQGRYDYDEFESWKQRVNAQAGLGHHLSKKDDLKLDIRLGAGPRREWGSENNDLEFEGIIGADFEWKISRNQTFTLSPYFFPVIGDMDDYRGRVPGEWHFLFDKDMNLSFLIGILYEYQSLVDPGKNHGDLRTYVGLRYGF